MRQKQHNPNKIRNKKRLYSPTSLTNAYLHVKNQGTSVRRAAKLFAVPESTLRDRTLGIVHIDTLSAGGPPLFDQLEEARLVNHFKVMAGYGHGYTRQECVDIATDFAIQLGKRQTNKPLTMNWMRGFLKRWPELKVVKPKGLELTRAKMASKDTVDEYFNNLKQSIISNNIEPHMIYTIDEKAVTIEHKPPHVVASSEFIPLAVTSGRGRTVTLIGAGSAAGQAIPPYLIFPGQRMRADLLVGSSPGADGTVVCSWSEWSEGACHIDWTQVACFSGFVRMGQGIKYNHFYSTTPLQPHTSTHGCRVLWAIPENLQQQVSQIDERSVFSNH